MKHALIPAHPGARSGAAAPRHLLVSHVLCPYVQRAAIALAEKGLPFERRDIDLSAKPGWFLAVSPLGKTPVLLVDGEALFESAVICEYLEDTAAPALHPAAPLQRARHRAWVEFASALLAGIAAYYGAADEAALQVRADELHARLQRLEEAVSDGPYFAGEAFSLVDAAFAPVFRYLDLFDRIDGSGFVSRRPRLAAWREALRTRPSVAGAVVADHEQRLFDFVLRRGSALSRRWAKLG